MILENTLIFIGACIVLIISAELLLKSLTRIAYYMHMSDFVIGFMVVAVATSIPELFVGITSAIEGAPELALGNVIGANIINLTLIVGIITLMKRGLKVQTKTVRTDTLYMFSITLLPTILMLDHQISRFDGFILLVAFFLYVIRLFKQERRFREKIKAVSHKAFIGNLLIVIISVMLLLLSADVIARSAKELAVELSVPAILIGLFMISLGTTLPELTFASKAVLSKHRYMALGDLLGSVVANTTLVLGTTALIHPIYPDFLLFITSAMFMVVISFLFMTFVESEKKITVQEGIALLLLYVLFIIVLSNIGLIEKTAVAI